MASFFQNLLGFFGIKSKHEEQKLQSITPMRKQLSATMKPIGMITHFYDKPMVGIVKLNEGKLCIGDRIRVTCADHYFDQTITSLQIEHKPVNEIHPGDSAGLQLKEKVHEGELVFKM